eukprot:CAMPEP_0117673432 /NCGR_PEP_ID=MMETSP0804-20121206/14473_1 /TAXON_ID=1074897 /ORGANISM="Tetraselmis astigmatica, Strain CCMP880" /LENGTH=306 /DNA_ID=CAMNT_0005482177 /DNA_START=18 /DNA_END=934 /DNA_ORIENTATION=-
MGKSFKYVYIPADVNEPIQEQTLEQPEGKEVECLLDTLNRSHGGKSAEQLAAQKQELLKNMPAGTKLDDAMLSMATSLGMVENIALLNNAKDLGFVGVNMYVDDEGAIKNVPFNPRASDIATCCGKPLQVRGDAFISRIFDNEDEFSRLDLSISEVSSSADWVKEAKRRNEAAAASSKSGGFDRTFPGLKQQQVPGSRATVVEISPAEAAKDGGNKAFKVGDFVKAVELYSEALSIDGSMMTALNNRAMAYLKLSKPELAAEDCRAVLQKEPDNVKALMRLATASEGQGDKGAAAQGLRRVLELEP